MSKNLNVSKAQFELFKQFHQEYCKQFGIISWSFFYEFIDLTEDDRYACINYSSNDRAVVTKLSTKWDDMRPLNNEELKKVAKHEALHLLMANFYQMATNRYATKKELDREEEAIVRTIEKLIN